jgi:hypothetical protein
MKPAAGQRKARCYGYYGRKAAGGADQRPRRARWREVVPNIYFQFIGGQVRTVGARSRTNLPSHVAFRDLTCEARSIDA